MIIVTGGAGFIGSNIVGALTERGRDRVVVCDTLGVDDKWRNIAKHNIADLIAPPRLFDYLNGLTRSAWIFSRPVDAIIHMGAISSTTETDADGIFETNVRLSQDLWTWCARNGARFIYASSAATYGDGSQGFDDDFTKDGLATLRPLNAYGWSKHQFDRRVEKLRRGLDRPPQWAGLKFFNVYGPNEYHKGSQRSVVLQVFERAMAGEPIRLFKSHHPDYPDGGQRRDFVSVADCVDVVLWLLDHPGVSGLFNMGTGRSRTFLDLATAVFAALDHEPRIEFIDTPPGLRDKYQYFTEARMERLRAAGYAKSFTSLEDAVADYVRGYLATDDPYR